MNRVAVWVTKALSKRAAVLLAWAVVGGMVAGCASTRIKRLSGAEFVTQANQIGQMNSFSWTCYVGSSPERAYAESAAK